MKILKNNGFIMVETLIVAAFVLGIFTFIYVNVIPLIGIYEQRNTYDDVESVYNIDTIRDNLDLTGLALNEFKTRADFCGTDTNNLCNSMLSAMEINYIGEINTNNVATISGEESINGIKEYLDYIGALEETKPIIVIVKQHTDQYSGDDNNIIVNGSGIDTKRTYPVRFANLKAGI